MLEYCDPFLNAPARHVKIRVEIDVDILSDLLSFKEIRNEMFVVEERMEAPEEERIDFLASIPKSKIRTRLEEVKVKNCTLNVIKDVQM